MLVLSHVSSGYGGAPVVRDVSFSVEPGELCILLGLNGSGKSTLLKAVCGLLPSAGSVSAAGVPLARLHERERARLLSYIPQRPSPDPSLTALDVVCMGYNPRLGLLESPSGVQKRRAEEALARVGLPGRGEALYGALSEGQRQLVVFARALVQDAPVMLMDEPDSALDFVNRRQVLDTIAALVRTEGRAGLITLHDPNAALRCGDRLLLLKEGALAGDLRVASSDAATLSAALSRLYGPVTLHEAEGRRFLL